ncbi:hypothetical protein GCK32_022665 [Trichostrongylus colubriformis]|uniref:Uncharacterized protein n=1 Tax=Trichostrongylus colubriformis TaxID=6319 RepID=A0AAN8FBJ7_TRICO
MQRGGTPCERFEAPHSSRTLPCDCSSSFQLLRIQLDLEKCSGKRIIHPPLFPAFRGYHTQSYYNQAIERLDLILKECDDSPANSTIVALPSSFLRAEKGLEENDQFKVMVYSTLDGLASQLNEQSISAAIVLVWRDSMPSTLHLNHVMHALEHHLQCEGTLDMYPPPYEGRRCEVWHSEKKVGAEIAEMLTGPARGFDARVVDAHGTIERRCL